MSVEVYAVGVSTPLEAVVSHVQRFSVHDGPGIRTTVFFKGCPLRCPWCHNPESVRPRAELSFDARRCTGSRACLTRCPQDAISLRGAPPSLQVDRAACDGCGECVEACAFGAFEIIGRTVGVEDLLDELARDKSFFAASGGGVTLSGGEATQQSPFLVALARRCAEIGVGVGLQTCGAASWATFEALLPWLEFIHFDLKLADDRRHRDVVGSGTRVIRDNARRLVEAGAPVVFRTPVVPGFTDDADNLLGLAAFLRELQVSQLHLLRYHRFGDAKHERLGRQPVTQVPPTPKEIDLSITAAASVLQAEGIAVILPDVLGANSTPVPAAGDADPGVAPP